MSELPLKKFSDYFYENQALEALNQLQISSVCNSNCIFCSNKQNPFKIKRLGFRPIEEVEKVIYRIPDDFQGMFILNESLPGRISEGEAFLHPQLFDILKLIREKFRNRINITTNGSFFTPQLVKKLSEFNPVHISLSMTSVKKENWLNSFRLDEKDYFNAVNCIPLLLAHHIDVSPSIVPMPTWFGYDDIENTIQFLAFKNVRSLLVYAPGYTKYTKTDKIEKMVYDKQELSEFFLKMSKKYNMVINWSLDPNKKLELNDFWIRNVLENVFLDRIKKCYWFTSIAAYDRFKDYFKIFPLNVDVVKVQNETYGGNIEVTGLWMVEDIRRTIKELQLEDQYILLPNNFIDNYGFDLMGENILDLQKETSNILHILKIR